MTATISRPEVHLDGPVDAPLIQAENVALLTYRQGSHTYKIIQGDKVQMRPKKKLNAFLSNKQDWRRSRGCRDGRPQTLWGTLSGGNMLLWRESGPSFTKPGWGDIQVNVWTTSYRLATTRSCRSWSANCTGLHLSCGACCPEDGCFGMEAEEMVAEKCRQLSTSDKEVFQFR